MSANLFFVVFGILALAVFLTLAFTGKNSRVVLEKVENAISSPKEKDGKNPIGKYMPPWWSILALLGSLFIVVSLWTNHEAPSLASVWLAAKAAWLSIIIGCVLLYVAGSLAPKEMGKDGKKESQAICSVLHGIAIFIFLFLFIAIPFLGWATTPGDKTVQAMFSKGEQSTTNGNCAVKCVLVVPGHGNSPPLNVPKGYRPHYVGDDIVAKCVYSNGEEGIIGDLAQPCHDGPMVYVYLTNTAAEPRTVVFESVL